jgi:hypothetical protein
MYVALKATRLLSLLTPTHISTLRAVYSSSRSAQASQCSHRPPCSSLSTAPRGLCTCIIPVRVLITTCLASSLSSDVQTSLEPSSLPTPPDVKPQCCFQAGTPIPSHTCITSPVPYAHPGHYLSRSLEGKLCKDTDLPMLSRCSIFPTAARVAGRPLTMRKAQAEMEFWSPLLITWEPSLKSGSVSCSYEK